MNKWKLTSEWKTVMASVMISCIVTILVLGALQSVMPWKFRFLQTDTIAIGGGSGQGSIILSAERALGGMVMATFQGPGGGESLTLSVGAMGVPSITLDSASGKPLLAIEVLPNRRPKLRFMDVDTGKEVWSVTVDGAGQPVVNP